MPNIVFGSSGAYGADNVYVVVKVPQPLLATGGATFQGGVVGAAQWGPKNTQVAVNTPADLMNMFGSPIDGNVSPLVQEGALFLKQQPQGGLVCVRQTDGTDAAATVTINDSAGTPAAGLIATALYTGSFGNQIKITLDKGTNWTVALPTWRITIQAGLFAPEVFDRIAQGAAGAFWVNAVAAINNGQGPSAPASQYVVASLPGTPSALPPAATGSGGALTLVGGLDGAGVNTAALLGVDGAAGTRTGMYALRKSKADCFWIAGLTDTTAWVTMLAYAKSETCLAIGSMALNTTPTIALSNKLTAGIDDPYIALAVNHVVYFDTILNKNVYAAPACVIAGIACAYDAHESPGNKKAYGILGTDKTFAGAQNLSDQDEANLEAAGIIFVSNNCPGFTGFGARHGKNSSSNFAQSEIAWTRKTNDLTRAFAGPIMGQFVNLPQSTKAGDDVREQVRNAFNSYLGQQKGKKIDDFFAQCDLNNNPVKRIQAGYLQADVEVQYLAIINKFVINLVAGQTVDVSLASSRLA